MKLFEYIYYYNFFFFAFLGEFRHRTLLSVITD